MTIDEITKGMKRLQASYPTMSKLDPLTVAAYMQEIGPIRADDFEAALTAVVRTSKFFPSIAEFLEAADTAARKRFEADEHEAREERLAIQGGEDRIFDPKSSVHRVVVGPNHQKFLDMLSGKIKLPEPEWMKRKKGTAAKRATENGYVPISDAERARRENFLRQQATMLLAEGQK